MRILHRIIERIRIRKGILQKIVKRDMQSIYVGLRQKIFRTRRSNDMSRLLDQLKHGRQSQGLLESGSQESTKIGWIDNLIVHVDR